MGEKKGFEVSSPYLLLVGFGILVVIVIFITAILPTALELAHGVCWRNTYDQLYKIKNEMADIEQGTTKPIFAEFDSSCTDTVLIMNRDQFAKTVDSLDVGHVGVENKFECTPAEAKGILAAVKKAENVPPWYSVVLAAAKSDKETLNEWGRALVGLNEATHCFTLKCNDCAFKGSLSLRVDKSAAKYCIKVQKENEKEYSLTSTIVKKESECK